MTTFEPPDVSELSVSVLPPKDNLVGICSFVVDRKFKINNVAIMLKQDGKSIRLLYPSRNVHGREIQSVYPITREVGEVITRAVEAKFTTLFSSHSFFDNVHESTFSTAQ